MCTYVTEVFPTSSCTVGCSQLLDVGVAALTVIIIVCIICILNKRDKLMDR